MQTTTTSQSTHLSLFHFIKDPGSAITHFIGMLLAIVAMPPLLIKAASGPCQLPTT